MNATAQILAEQMNWAAGAGLSPNAAGYLPNWQDNLARPLSDSARIAFQRGAGSELVQTADGPPKMGALHSSAALAVNFFDFWTERSLEPLAAALDLGQTPDCFSFESTFSTSLRGTPPTLDVAFRNTNGSVVGVESKFTEWLAPKVHGGNNFAPSYFPDGPGLWAAVGLEGAQSLTNDLRTTNARFRYLDVAQLLKHMLGLATQHRGAASLYYLFYDWPSCPESALHRAELEVFCARIGSDLPFRWASYQEVFARFTSAFSAEHGTYLQYLKRRYFRN